MYKNISINKDHVSRLKENHVFVKKALCCCVASLIGFSQYSNSASLLEEVMVTAQKQAESAQDVGISMTAFTSDQLEKLGVGDSVDIARFTPGVSLSGSFAGQQQQFSIRGVTQNDFNDHVESPNAVYIDEGYVSFQQGSIFATFDIERVEVLKGPQGTLFGRNATGGLVHYISNRPTQELSGYIEAEVGDYNKKRIEAAISGPVTDDISYRLSGFTSKYDGYLENDYPQKTYTTSGNGAAPLSNGGADLPGAGDDLGGDESWALRGQLVTAVNDNSDLSLIGFYSESKQSTGPYQATPTIAQVDANGNTLNTFRIGPNETREIIGPNGVGVDAWLDGDSDNVRPAGRTLYGYLDPDGNDFTTSSDYAFDDINTYKTYGGTVNYYLELPDGMTLSAITDFKHHDKFTTLDLDAGPQSQFTYLGEADIDSVTQEFRLSGDSEADGMRWMVGLFYLDIDALSIGGLSALKNSSSGFPADFEQPRVSYLETKSYSIFGQMEFDLTETLKLTTGLRGTNESKDYTFDVYFTIPNVDPNGWEIPDRDGGSPAVFENHIEDDNSENLWTGKIQLDWQVNDDMLIYTGFNRGVKAGSFNSGDHALTPELAPYEKEVLHAYELGIKSEWLENTVRINGAAYYYDYKDYQAARWTGLANVITNNDSTVQGVEVEVITSPIDNLDVMLTAAYIDANVEDLNLIGDGSILVDVTPTFSPKKSFSAFINYTIEDVFEGELSLQLNSSYQSSIYSNLSNFDSTEFDSWTVTDVRASWVSSEGNWIVSTFIKNVTDERYNVIGFDLSTVCGCNEEAQGKPKWAGASVKYIY
ncbi:TonB-dependent receptor [Dasania sp. GY-MA-18]|uniref:TonB-dependent receptor n=1 Tax=Dasania phycosphaerae TaxID=2950436 RepID=A0A9J6RKX8_9GAMM|nr:MULTISPECIES: TonB-dependent receptor [Dasania]MCR8922646.1 TonB-dependent receptor [Dasania sp. GY-MA-18]MCZ0865076.1 TonB-dependent receptor [Dasania phycosphaerae]MCZ0868802.1 TonB-dependent receptor [Dasania phycosphaerae]